MIDLTSFGGGKLQLTAKKVSDLGKDNFIFAEADQGTSGHDILFGLDADDTIDGEAGHDHIFGYGGDDRLFGGSGNDVIDAGAGNDLIRGDDGNDTIHGGAGNDLINGSAGNDIIHGGEGNEQIWGGNHNDTLYGDGGNDNIAGGLGDDTITGGTGNDYLIGNQGNDIFVYNKGDGNDVISDFNTDEDQIDLSSMEIYDFTDLSISQNGDDTVISFPDGDGSITLRNFISSNLSADDFILSDDKIIGTDNGETLTGGSGDDVIDGGAGHDFIQGNGGDDIIIGGRGHDKVVGGEGNDIFVYNKGDGIDFIRDFGTGDDQIDISSMGIYDISALSIYQAGNQAIISFPDGGRIALDNFQASDLSAEDFIFTVDQTISGTENADTLEGGYGNDILTGGEGSDTFVFIPGEGTDVVTDFTNGVDSLDVSAFESLTYDDLTFTQEGNDVRISSGANDVEIVLNDFSTSDLDATDFIFHDSVQIDGM